MADLDKLFDGFKAGRMKYPEPRRKTEDEFFGELVARIKALEEQSAKALTIPVWPEPVTPPHDGTMSGKPTEPLIDPRSGGPDRMAAARAAKAAKRSIGPAVADDYERGGVPVHGGEGAA